MSANGNGRRVKLDYAARLLAPDPHAFWWAIMLSVLLDFALLVIGFLIYVLIV